jgi:PKD repeat protein
MPFAFDLFIHYLVLPLHHTHHHTKQVMKKNLLILALLFACTIPEIKAQDWVQMMQDPSVNFYQVQQAFNKYWAKEEKKTALRKLVGGTESQAAEENYEKYKRWEYFTEQRVYPSGDRSLIAQGGKEIQEKFIASRNRTPSSMQMTGNWTLVGPTSQISSGGGAGRLNCVRFDPSNPATIYVGAPAGGLWKSTNAGLSWTTNTDRLAVIGISDVAVDPIQPNTIYVATGDGEAGDTYSNGVLKSTDGGLTWNPTGLNFNIVDTRQTYRLIINPQNHNALLAATSSGIFKTLDGGVTWAKCLNTAARGLEFKPGDTTVVYAVSSSSFFKSTNAGNSFVAVSSGLPTPGAVCRLTIAVTAADPTYVYVVAATASAYNFYGLYRSTDQGQTFTKQSSTPNVLGFNTNGGDTGGQGWYTLSLAASPTNKNEIIVGGVNVWHSTTGGASWTNISSWTGFGGPYVHADIHALNYLPGSGTTFFAACDGGFFKTTNSGGSWTDLSNGLEIGEMYRLGVSQSNPNMVIQGWQDNGTNEWDIASNPVWNQVYGGDGMECFIDYTNTNYQYGEVYNGGFARTTNAWGSSQNITNGLTGTGAWVTPWCMDPVTPSTLYAGYNDVWKSINRGTTWTKISNFGGGSLSYLAVAKSNPQYIYCGVGSNLLSTSNGGTNWTNLSPFLPGGTTITHVDISTTNPNVIWITYSGFSANSKVYKSKDGGHTWINMSASLPNIPVTCSVNQPGTADGVYIGTDVGIYYTDTTMTNWVFFSNGLPNVIVDELEIQVSSKKLFAATYGRGLWVANLYDPTSTLPLANFNSDITTGCPGMTVQFTDLSTNSPTSWNWYFAGGTPSSSSAQNPSVVFNTPGSYNLVKMTATNASGSDSVTKYSYIGVSPQALPLITLTGKDTVCAGTLLVLTSSFGSSYSWSPNGQINPSIAPSTSGTYSVTITDAFGCLCHSAPKTIVIDPLPTPVITKHGDTLVSSYANGNQWYLGSTLIPGATSQNFVMSGTGNFTVHEKDSLGCSGTSNIISGIPENLALENAMNVFPNPNNGQFVLSLLLTQRSSYTLRISDVTGREVYSEQLQITGPTEQNLDLSAYGKGIYLLEIVGQKGKAMKKIAVY